jgi:hypothetical protein
MWEKGEMWADPTPVSQQKAGKTSLAGIRINILASSAELSTFSSLFLFSPANKANPLKAPLLTRLDFGRPFFQNHYYNKLPAYRHSLTTYFRSSRISNINQDAFHCCCCCPHGWYRHCRRYLHRLHHPAGYHHRLP